MRSSIILTAAFAATAFSTPMKRDVIVETDTATEIDYVTDIITVTAGEAAPTSVAAAAATTSSAAGYHWGHHSWHHHSSAAPSSAAPVSSSAAPAPSSSSEAPAPTTSEAPAPVTTTSEAPAPAPTTSEAPAPSSYSAPAASSSAAATSAAPASSSSSISTYTDAVVDHHNIHRANHSAPDVTWSQEMADLAQEIANSCIYAHDMTKGTYGQNIAVGVEANNISTIISDMFYNGEVSAFQGNYGVADPTGNNFEAWGHFSQVVWKGTTSVGCATKTCSVVTDSSGNKLSYPPHFTVCNYSPPGNYQGEFNTNVGQSLGDATLTWITNLADPAQGVTGDGY